MNTHSTEAITNRAHPQQATDAAGRPLATWNLRGARAWLAGVCVALCGLLLTAAGSAVGAVAGLDERAATWLLAAFAAVSAVAGAVWMVARRPASTWGFRRPKLLASAGWGLPLVVTIAVALATGGISVAAPMAIAYAALAGAVALNEEIWFRGLALAALRGLGARTACVGSAALFGVLHLANAAGGKPPAYLALQVVFAFAVGLALAELVALTGSLWIGVAWHFAYDFATFLGGDALNPTTLVGAVIIDAILISYAAFLWRRLPRR